MKEKYLSVKNLSIVKGGRIILQNFSMSLNKGESICLLGESGSGKSLIFDNIKSLENNVFLVGSLDSYNLEKMDINTWKGELHYSLQTDDVKKFLDSFFKNKKYVGEKVYLLKKIFNKPDFFLLDDVSAILTDEEKINLFAFLNKLGIAFCYATRNIEDTLYFLYTIVLKNKSVAIEGKTALVLEEEKLMKVLGYSLPFYVNLSRQLKLYDILPDICYSKEELEACLWP